MTESSEIYFTSTWNFCGSCPSCSFVLPPLKECAKEYFEKGFVKCEECSARVDVWQVALARVDWAAHTDEVLVGIGATRTVFTETIEAGKSHTIHLPKYGVPADATVLAMVYTPQGGGVFPIEWHGNRPRRRLIGTDIIVIGVPAMGEGPESSVAIAAIWVPKEESDAWSYLTQAFEMFSARQYAQVLGPAQSAVEISLMPIVSEVLERHAAAENVKSLIEGGNLTYGHVLNVLLPFMCAQADIPVLPDPIRGLLNRLRKLRNELVHKGKSPGTVGAEDAGQCLCAAAFGFEYVRYAGPMLRERLK
jgi:hypothetical protein